jgi:hypothetical protein
MENETSPIARMGEAKKAYKARFLSSRPRPMKKTRKVAIMISEELNQALCQITFLAGINKLKRGDLFENILEDHVTKNNPVIQEMLKESLTPYKQEG